MEFAYFKTDKKNTEALIEEWKSTQTKVNAATEAIKEKYGTKILWMRGDHVIGFVLKGYGHDDRRGFKKVETVDQGEEYSIFTPNARFKEGKEFKALNGTRKKAIESSPNFSDYIVRKFDVNRWISGAHSGPTGMALYSSTAGVVKNILVIRVPTNAEQAAPEIPDFTAIKKSEYIAITEE